MECRLREPPEGEVIVADLGEGDPNDTDELEEYLRLSGFESVEEWRGAVGVAHDEDGGVEGRLYLVVLDDQEDDE